MHSPMQTCSYASFSCGFNCLRLLLLKKNFFRLLIAVIFSRMKCTNFRIYMHVLFLVGSVVNVHLEQSCLQQDMIRFIIIVYENHGGGGGVNIFFTIC